MSARVFVGCDHAGFSLKQTVLESLKANFPDLSIEDRGCFSETSVDYPAFAKEVAELVRDTPQSRGILICGSGIGMTIAANKVAGIRAAQVWDATSARLSRQHNDANIVCFGARLIGPEVALEICRVWLTTEYLAGRHQKRLDLIRKMEESS